jgi:hypothetical protein
MPNPTGWQRKEMFNQGNVLHQDGRYDPNPYFATIEWRADADAEYTKIRAEVKPANLASNQNRGGGWSRRAKSAYDDWFSDHQNPVKLFRVSSYLGTATHTEEGYRESKAYILMSDYVNLGFSILRPENTPASYEFCRRAYIEKAGDSHYHLMKDLAKRLLRRAPADRNVAISMVREYFQRKADAEFEQILFAALFASAKTKDWQAWDDQWIARAMCAYGRQHEKKSYYDKALTYMDKAIAKTPRGTSPAPMKELRAGILRERDLPNFGYPLSQKSGGI